MTIAPTELFPPELLDASRQKDAVLYVLAQPWPGAFKGRVLKGWFKYLGVPIDPRALEQVEKSGP